MSSMYGGHILSRAHADALDDQARTAPFTAVLDGQGRLTSLALQVPVGAGFNATTYRVSYSGYGATTRPEPPAAGDQTPAPGWIYPLFREAQYAGSEIRGK
jgi:hypothetical protein